jgi:hypothetical protein
MLASAKADIQHYFNFLIEEGYEFSKLEYIKGGYGGGWQVIFKSSSCVIHIVEDQSRVSVLFAPLDEGNKTLIGLEAMIFYLSQEKIFIGEFDKSAYKSRGGQLEKLASLLKEYINQISPYFGSDFNKYKDALMMSKQKYSDIWFNKYFPKKKEPKVWDWE